MYNFTALSQALRVKAPLSIGWMVALSEFRKIAVAQGNARRRLRQKFESLKIAREGGSGRW